MKRLKIAAVISGILTLLQALPAIIPLVSSFILDMRVASSIGIIGSADGPTAIFTAFMIPPFIAAARYIFFAACLITFIISVALLIKNRNKTGE